MTKLLAIDWSLNQVRLLLANSQAGKLTLEHIQSIAVELPANPQDEAAESVREQIALALRDSRYRNADVLLAVRRADVELRLMSLPPVPSEELPDIVRMQAMREFSEVSDDWPLDYLPLQGTPEETRVLAAVVSPRKLANLKSLLAMADLKPKACVLRPTATALLVNQLDDSLRPEVELCIDDLETECEMSVLRDGNPILIRTIQVPRSEGYDPVVFLSQEIRRTMVAAHNQLQGNAVQRVVMFGVADDGTAELGIQLQARLQLPVRVLNPFGLAMLQTKPSQLNVRQPRQLAASIGLLISQSLSEPSLIDFVNPRKVVPPKSRRPALIAAAIATLVIVGLGLGGAYWHLSRLDARAANLQAAIQQQRPLVEAAQARIDEVTAIQAWEKGDVNWLSQLSDISSKVPAAEQAKLERWQADLLASGDGQIILEGAVDQQETIGAIDQALRSEQRRVQGAGGELSDLNTDLPWRFKHTLTIPTNANPRPAAATRSRRAQR